MKTIKVLTVCLAVGSFLLGYAVAMAAPPAKDHAEAAIRRFDDSKLMLEGFQWGAFFYIYRSSEGGCTQEKGWFNAYVSPRAAPPMPLCARVKQHHPLIIETCSNVGDKLNKGRCWDIENVWPVEYDEFLGVF